MAPECVHTLPSGAVFNPQTGEVTDQNGKHLDNYHACAHARVPFANGPDAGAVLPNGNISGYTLLQSQHENNPSLNHFTYLSAQATVPSAPQFNGYNAGPFILFFPGLEDEGANYIMQPELAWDPLVPGWVIYDEYNSATYDVKDTPVNVSPGQYIDMVMRVSAFSHGYQSWDYWESDQQTGASTNGLNVVLGNPYLPTWAIGAALEIEGAGSTPTGINSCHQLPSAGQIWIYNILFGDNENGAGEVGANRFHTVPYNASALQSAQGPGSPYCNFVWGTSCYECDGSNGGVAQLTWIH